MMKFIFYTPLCFFNFNWNLIQLCFILVMMVFINISKFSFFSCVLYGQGVDYYSYSLIILSILIISLMIISMNSIKLTFMSGEFLFVNLGLCLSLVMLFCSMNMLIMCMFFWI